MAHLPSVNLFVPLALALILGWADGTRGQLLVEDDQDRPPEETARAFERIGPPTGVVDYFASTLNPGASPCREGGMPGCPDYQLAPHQRLFAMLSPGGRHRGKGLPLVRESWLYRPWSAGWFMGGMAGGPLKSDWVGMAHGFVGGYRLGYDFDYYWGTEMRFSFASVKLYDSPEAVAAQQAADDEAGLAPDDPRRQRYDHRRDGNVLLWDLDLLYYPWGDATWRPYFLIGLGTAKIGFNDRLENAYDSTAFAMPLAFGLKYRWNNWLALRFEMADNMAFGTGSFKTIHNFSITGGMEVRFGGSRTAYWPWNPGRCYW